MELTRIEKEMLGKRICVTRSLQYGGKVGDINTGEEGIIYDYGSQSGDPFVRLDRGLEVVIPWDSLTLR